MGAAGGKMSDATLQHYINLASSPGWKDYAWQAVKQLASQQPSLYKDLPAQLTAAMLARKNVSVV